MHVKCVCRLKSLTPARLAKLSTQRKVACTIAYWYLKTIFTFSKQKHLLVELQFRIGMANAYLCASYVHP